VHPIVGLGCLAVAAFLYAVVPSVLLALLQGQRGYVLLRSVTDQFVTFTLALTMLLGATRLPRPRKAVAGTIVSAAATYGLALWFLIGYWVWTGHQFDIRFALDAGGDVLRTLESTLGRFFLPAIGMTIALFACLALLWWQIARWFEERSGNFFRSWTISLPLGLQALVWHLCAHEQRMVWPELHALIEQAQEHPVVGPIFPDSREWQTRGGESVYVLQLESGNALALSGALELAGRRYDGDYTPNLRRIAQDGVFFPIFWANSVQSNRALENILCGIVNNAGPALSYNPGKIASECLPAVLRRAGYATIFYVAFDDPDFMNYRNFAKAIGFDEFYDAPSLGFPARKDSWGIDDCTFYRSVFANLRKRPPGEKRFVYIEVSAHHYPFAGQAQYAHLHPFILPQNPVEWYLNSWVEQDHCLEVFYHEFREFTGGDAHLFVTPDHSWPVGTHGNVLNDFGWYDENFAIPFLYVPPLGRRSEFRVGEQADAQPSLADLPATIVELLDGVPRKHSFAPLLQRHPADGRQPYEPCHILVQPYSGGAIVIQRPREKYVYHINTQQLERYDRRHDPNERNPEVVAENIPYSRVKADYYCDRYLRSAQVSP